METQFSFCLLLLGIYWLISTSAVKKKNKKKPLRENCQRIRRILTDCIASIIFEDEAVQKERLYFMLIGKRSQNLLSLR